MSRLAWAALAALCSAGLLTAGCRPDAASSGTVSPSPTPESSTADACPVTSPTEQAIPEGVREHRYGGGAVFGQGALWVGAWWADRSFLKQFREQRPYVVKYPSFTIRDGEVTDALGPPLVRAERLDGIGGVSGTSGGYATATQDGSGRTLHWWPTVIHFSGAGCWQVTETVADTTITYVVQI